jgi:IS1 family transposase
VHEDLVDQARDLGQGQADERRVKKQGGVVWMALAMMVKTRLWLGGEGSEQRDLARIRRLIERVRRCAVHCPLLVCTDGWWSYIRAIRETLRDSVHTGQGGRPRLRPWRNVLIAQGGKRYERRRGVETDRRIVDGTPPRVATLRRRAQGHGVINTASIERLNAMFRERLAPLARRGRALARQTLPLHEGMFLVGTV